MKNWVARGITAVLFGFGLLVLAWVVPSFLDSAAMANMMLKPNYRMPELVSAYIPELVQTLRHGFGAGVAAALISFVIWSLVILIGRPTGPGQVSRSWRCGLWWGLLVVVTFTAGLLSYFGVTAALDMIDDDAATRLAVLEAAVAALIYWGLSLLGAEQMTLPAIPLGAWLVGSK